MADITQNLLLDASDQTDLSVYTTASVSPGANLLQLLLVGSRNVQTSTAPLPTVAGNGLTWVQVATLAYLGSDQHRITVFRAMGGSPSSGTIVITMSEDQFRCGWILSEFNNIDTGGSDGADAVIQSATAEVSPTTSLTVTLSAFGNSANATWGGIGTSSKVVTPGTGFAELADQGGQGLPASQFRDTNDTTVRWTFATNDAGGIGIEIKNATPASTSSAAGTSGHLGIMF